VSRTRPDERQPHRDRELLGELAAGRPEALAELYDRYAASLFRHAMALCRRQTDAEDLVHATFVKLATTGADLPGVRSPAGYLHRTLHTTWMDGRRRFVVGERVAEQMTVESGMPAPAMEDSIDMARALNELAAPQREVIVLHLIEGFSFREIGQATGVSLFTAAARYRLGLARLRRHLERPAGGRP
jgi:RNA polymerase sigma-70 factor (ECF subfamily)